MALSRYVLLPFQTWNDIVLRAGWWISVVAIGLMVLSILTQVFFRYVLGDPLAWSEEAARFCMLWMTGFMAPLAYRQGGFVAIDMVVRILPPRAGEILSFILLVIPLVVLVTALPIGWGEVTGFSSKFATASLYYPNLEGGWTKVPRSWMGWSLLVGVVLLLTVNIELMLRSIISLFGGGDTLRPIPGATTAGGE
ncbi:MAG: TRAP transporter small permease subunit [Inquilinus sp.]|nr:TRAP transporter small permease subunit [Inquilinus sp.]